MTNTIPEEIQRALGPLLTLLPANGVVAVDWNLSSSFGNFYITFRGNGKEFQIIRDRGEIILGGPDQEVLEQAGLWRTFPGVNELRQPLIQWLNAGGA